MANKYLIGRKMGMTRLFDDFGTDYPVTIIEAGPCSITQIKTIDKEGYSSIQIGYGNRSEKHSSKAIKGHCSKAGVPIKSIIKEFNVSSNHEYSLGDEFDVNIFHMGDMLNVSGVSKGKGFAGHMKRHGFGGGRASHGKNSVMRKAGSVGAGTSPGRVWKGTRMAGRMGGDNVTVKNLEIVRIDNVKKLIFVKGAVPGPKNGIIYLSKNN